MEKSVISLDFNWKKAPFHKILGISPGTRTSGLWTSLEYPSLIISSIAFYCLG